MNRILLGALGGLVGTAAMTAAMRRLFVRLPPGERYPLPPREIIDRLTGPQRHREGALQVGTLAAHFGYGAATGAFFAAIRPRPGLAEGAAYGVAVWAASYLGWIPAAGILRSATSHPARRNALMIAAHTVWGAVLAASMREMRAAERTIFASRQTAESLPVPPPDARRDRRVTPRREDPAEV